MFKKMNDIFITYESRYSGAFPLLDSFKYPKMCASESRNLTDGISYYRASSPKTYDINKKTDYGYVVVKMG